MLGIAFTHITEERQQLKAQGIQSSSTDNISYTFPIFANMLPPTHRK